MPAVAAGPDDAAAGAVRRPVGEWHLAFYAAEILPRFADAGTRTRLRRAS
jgi:hypothetical protein